MHMGTKQVLETLRFFYIAILSLELFGRVQSHEAQFRAYHLKGYKSDNAPVAQYTTHKQTKYNYGCA